MLRDQKLVDALRANGFQGDGYTRFAERLARHGLGTIEGWMRSGLIAGRWSPDRGASPLTYFIGMCIDAYPNAFRTWRRSGSRSVAATADRPEPESADWKTPESEVIAKEQIIGRWAALPERRQRVLVLEAQGLTHDQIARLLGVPIAATTALLHRARKGLRGQEEV
ncbi:sigma factor-like helix-turn-helix DNA-binding protein [Actinoplanes sp. NPDC048796]|uniref:RNA polymerase sigma factor n=1 Tax=unclassified Actinoplanes TaxID=2626549 RepID=UPI0033FBCA40